MVQEATRERRGVGVAPAEAGRAEREEERETGLPVAGRPARAKNPPRKRKAKGQGERNKELGRRGEDAAARFLERRGYDIVARDRQAVVFVEVKTRSGYAKGLPSEAVDAAKRDRYEKIAAAFLAEYDVVDVPVRFDVVSIVTVAPDRAMIRHHIDAFGAE